MRQNTRKNQKGFTLIETMISLVLVSMGLILISNIILFSMDAHRKSTIRFNMLQKLEYYKTKLITRPFDSSELQDGSYARDDEKFKLSWSIKSITPTLKKIRLTILYQGTVFNKKIYFYKSKFIKEMKND